MNKSTKTRNTQHKSSSNIGEVDSLVKEICGSSLFDLNDKFLYKKYKESLAEREEDSEYFFSVIIPESYSYLRWLLDYVFCWKYGAEHLGRKHFNFEIWKFVIDRTLERIKSTKNELYTKDDIKNISDSFERREYVYRHSEKQAILGINGALVVYINTMARLLQGDNFAELSGYQLGLQAHDENWLLNNTIKPLFGV